MDIIDNVGPGNNFLMQEHTFENYKTAFHFPRFLDRQMYEAWEKACSNDLRTVLCEKAKEIFYAHQPEQLSATTQKAIASLIEKHRSDV